MTARLLAAALDLYRLLVRPLLPPLCRFSPSCSDFARQALLERGAAAAAPLILGRLLRCHPFHPGGYDPITRHG